MEIIVTTDDNDPPAFNDTQYEIFITADSNEEIMDLSLSASDRSDAPSFGNGEVFFSEIKESDLNTNDTTGEIASHQ